jgi:hypothetical protein
MRFTALGQVRETLLTPGRDHELRIVRLPDRLWLFIDGAEVLAEDVPALDAPQLRLQGSWSELTGGDEVSFGELEVRASVLRPGRRVQLLEASLLADEGIEVTRARALQLRAAQLDAGRTAPTAAPPGPEHGRANDIRPRYRPMFSPDAVEIRFVAGAFYDRGPATAWFRLRVPLVAGEHASTLQRLAAAGDFGNGISSSLSWDEYVFINPDLTLYIERPPAGEWIAVEARTIIPADGIGVSEGVLYDERGRVGRATQALLITPR